MNDMAEEKAAVTAEVTEQEQAAADGEVRQVMYIGPNRLREGLRTTQVFKGYPKDLVERMKEKYPHIGRLFVDIEKLAEATEAVQRKGTPLFLAYQEILGVDE